MRILADKYRKRPRVSPRRDGYDAADTSEDDEDDNEDEDEGDEAGCAEHCVAGTGSGNWSCALPADVRVKISEDGSSYVDTPLDSDERLALYAIVKRSIVKEGSEDVEVRERAHRRGAFVFAGVEACIICRVITRGLAREDPPPHGYTFR